MSRDAQAERVRAEFLRMRHADLLKRFGDLDAPALEEMRGEYRATLLDQGSTVQNVLGRLATNVPQPWLCKAFEPLSEHEGHGYNGFRGRRGTIRRYRMKTHVGPSVFDGRGSYHLVYAPYNRGYMATMHDELRKVADGVYLGIGQAGWGRLLRGLWMPFLLQGPTAPFHQG